jgi:hypothetical protein
MSNKDICPKCGLESETLVGLRYPCGSYYTFGGFTQSNLCKKLKKIISVENEKLND